MGIPDQGVAPLAGAWIETRSGIPGQRNRIVAPLAGAWIETTLTNSLQNIKSVAPLAGAWIETLYAYTYLLPYHSRSPRGSVD